MWLIAFRISCISDAMTTLLPILKVDGTDEAISGFPLRLHFDSIHYLVRTSGSPFYPCCLPRNHFNILLATFPTSLLQPGCQRDRILVVCQSNLTMENISCQPKTNQQIPQRSDILKVYQLTSSLSIHCCKPWTSTASLSARGSIISLCSSTWTHNVIPLLA